MLKRGSRSAETNRDVSSTSLRHPLRKALLATTVYVALLVPVGALPLHAAGPRLMRRAFPELSAGVAGEDATAAQSLFR